MIENSMTSKELLSITISSFIGASLLMFLVSSLV